MSALAQLRALRSRPCWVPTLLLLLAVAILTLEIVKCAALIIWDAADRLRDLTRTAGAALRDAPAGGHA